jgi:penicillin-binding protein 2
VAGKTGTAQVVNLEKEKTFVQNGVVPFKLRDHAWFVAVAPVEEPKIAMAILMEHGGHGGKTAAPVAKVMIESYLGPKTVTASKNGVVPQ